MSSIKVKRLFSAINPKDKVGVSPVRPKTLKFSGGHEDSDLLDMDILMDSSPSFCLSSSGNVSTTSCDSAIDLKTPCTPSSHIKMPKIIKRMERSPLPLPKFDFDESDEDAADSGFLCNQLLMSPCHSVSPVGSPPVGSPPCFSPPHNRMRSLNLCDTPHTPRSLFKKSQRRIGSPIRDASNSLPRANVNPYTPSRSRQRAEGTGKKRLRDQSVHENMTDFASSLMEDSMDEAPSTKKIALREINTSRYNEEFCQMSKLGDGEFGSVFKCIHKLDGCTYAVKRSKGPVAGSALERAAVNEVYAHAVLGTHTHVVRYFSAWAEKNHMYIQNEYCNGGNLAELIELRKKLRDPFTEPELKEILYQLCKGLRYVHSQSLAHLDIKPGNVFIHRMPKSQETAAEAAEMCEDSNDFFGQQETLYKIGDLGHVTKFGKEPAEDGDCRYLPREILQEKFTHLAKVDIFSLALAIYETACFKPLPKNGDGWHTIREGRLPPLEQCSSEFNDLLVTMIHSDPELRPSASQLCQHPLLNKGRKSKDQLRRELNEEKLKNEMLSRQLEEATAQAEQDTLAPLKSFGNNMRRHRLIGQKIKRSMSSTVF